ncbi:MAG TPA: AAA family ATPase [Bryobacteraceae bacterium]|nr:AAA family ATPase [Bryobacteraceae bacterium]
MALSSRTFRVLVSSAFSDLPNEHGILYGDVFPKLGELCRRHAWRFQAIDLSPAAGLQDLTRFRSFSPPPIYICVAGERYGYRPLPEIIPGAEFAQIEKRVPAGAVAFLREWYRLDANAVPPVHVLQHPSGVFAQPAAWERFVATPLHSLLVDAVSALDLPPEERLKYEASATEQEIQAALAGKDGGPVHIFCFARAWDPASAEPDADSRARLEALRKRLRQQLGGNCYEYTPKSLGTLAATATAALYRLVQAEIKPQEKLASEDRENAAHEAFGHERARWFTGRAKPVERIAQYLHGADPHPLVVAGPPGSGKSALLAHSLDRYRSLRRDAVVIYRAAGATAESVDGRALLAEVCRRLGRATPSPAAYTELIEQFPERLKTSAASAPVTVILDGLDQWPHLDQARDLDWLPATLPAGARLIVAASSPELVSRLKKKVPAGNIVEPGPMTIGEGGRLLDLWLRDAGRTLSAAQRTRVLEGFRACPLPGYLRLSFEEARRWRSSAPPSASSLAPDMAGQIDALLARLAKRHGRALVARCLGYLAAARQGLAEDEIFELLARDGLVTAATWPPLCADLWPYLIARAADGVTLLAFAHREFQETAAQSFLAGEERRARHQALAGYFEESGYPARRLAELARQQALGGLWGPLEATLTSFDFAEAKARAGLLCDLVDDHRIAASCWRSEKPGPPPWYEWSRFLSAEARTIEATFAKHPQILFQQAFNHSLDGRVSRAARALVQQGREPREAWFERVNRPELPPGRDCLATFEGHSGPVSSIALAAAGELVVSGGVDGTLRVWRLSTGACLRVMRGHTSGIMAVVVAGAQGNRVVSASWDTTLRVWDLDSGECLHVLGGHLTPVVSLAAVGTERVASGSTDGGLSLWEIETGKCLAACKGHRDRINSILAIPGDRIASASDDGSVQVWNQDGLRLGVLTGHGGPVLHLNWIGGSLATSCHNGKILMWDLETSKTRDILVGHTGPVAGTAPLDAARLVSWSFDNTVRFWSLVDGSQLLVLGRHASPVTCVQVLKDGRLLSASEDSTLRLWDPEGASLGVMAGHRSWVTSLATGAEAVISAGRDGTLKVWDPDAVSGENPARRVDVPLEIARSHALAGVFVVDATTAISVTGEPEWYQLWDLEKGVCLQSAAATSEAGRQLRERIRGRAAVPGPSFFGGPRSQWGFAIRGAAGNDNGTAPGLALTREREREEGLFDPEPGELAFYPVVCHAASWTFECEYGIAFDARTREPHIVKAHHGTPAAVEPEAGVAPPGGLRSLVRKLWGRGDKL